MNSPRFIMKRGKDKMETEKKQIQLNKKIVEKNGIKKR